MAHGIDKIVFSSTAATYGEPESIPILETDPTVPTNCYGETKLSMEKMFHWTSIAHNLRYVSCATLMPVARIRMEKLVRLIILKHIRSR